MKFKDAKLFYIFSCIAIGLIILLPSLFAVFPLPREEMFSELWLLDSNHKILDELFTVSENISHMIYFDVANHMGDLEFYKVNVKFRNQNEPLPNRILAPLIVVNGSISL